MVKLKRQRHNTLALTVIKQRAFIDLESKKSSAKNEAVDQ